jgi:hypothetical protein
MGVVTRFSKITPAKKWEPLIPLDTLVDGLKYKQQLFDKNASIVQSQLDQGAQLASQIDNLEIRKKYQTDFNDLVTNINSNFSTADLTKQDVMGKVNEQGRSIAENPMYAQGLAISRHFRDQEKLIDESKTEAGGKYYNPSAEYVLNKNYTTFKNASIKDYGKAQLTEYSPYYDTTEQEMKLMDKIKPEVEAEITNMGIPKSSDMYIQRVEELTKDRVKSAMLNLYQNDPKALRQFQFDYEYNMDTKPIDIDQHAQKRFSELNTTITNLTKSKDLILDNDLKKQYEETINAYVMQRDNISKRYEEAKKTGDASKYYTINDFMTDRAEGSADTYAYKKVLSLSADPFSLATKNHNFKLSQMQTQHALNVERDRLKAYAEATGTASDASKSIQDGIVFEGSKLLNAAVTAGADGVKISNGDVANLTGETNPTSDGNYGLNATVGGNNIRTVSFMGDKLTYDKKTGKYYMIGTATSKQKVEGGEEVPTYDKLGNKVPGVASYRYQGVKVEVNPTTAALTRNKVAYGSGKTFGMSQSSEEYFSAARKSAVTLSSTIPSSGETLVTDLKSDQSSLNIQVAKIKNPTLRAQAKKYVKALSDLANQTVLLGEPTDIHTLAVKDPNLVGTLNYLLQTSEKSQ